jgi:hypothetical protein
MDKYFKDKAQKILSYLPPINNKKDKLVSRQNSYDIIKIMMSSAVLFQPDYNNIPVDTFESLEELWKFTKNTFEYKEDSEFAQDIFSPGVMLTNAIQHTNTIDCKNYSMFIAGILQTWCDAGENFNWYFKFVSYKDTDPTHVYIVCNGYVLDCCENKFDKESICFHYICCNPFTKDMAINRITGNNINKNPTPYGRQGQIGEGSGGGGGSKGGGGKGKPPKQPKGGKKQNVPLFAPPLEVTQPTATTTTGSIHITNDAVTIPLFLAGAGVGVLNADGSVFQEKGADAGQAQIGATIVNIPPGKYIAYFHRTVKGKKIVGKGTPFEIVAAGSNVPAPGKTVVNPKSNIFTPTNIAVAGGVLIGGYLLMKKK